METFVCKPLQVWNIQKNYESLIHVKEAHRINTIKALISRNAYLCISSIIFSRLHLQFLFRYDYLFFFYVMACSFNKFFIAQ